ncbi:hypothetical protein BDP27DRAFT_1510018 [Rhodocollybia butyracea]|uniref:Uncharacterized protein n=1 Tax=Rhodocollybia butyracea TaxID=206335 RepID=A0A9P5Q3G6_9AGAR|nr:hypothetical protein BDP27DRAFT_1510018 [Rhodocollybia butyracea]
MSTRNIAAPAANIPLPTLQAHAQNFLRWRDDEVAAALKDINLAHQKERRVCVELENQLRACQRHLELVQRNEAKVIAEFERVSADLEQASADLARLSCLEENMKFVVDALNEVGVYMFRNTEEVAWLRLLCDAAKEPRWAGVQREYSAQHELPQLDDASSTMNQPLDAVVAIDTLLDVFDKRAQSHNQMEKEMAQLRTNLVGKDSRIAELEATVALLRGDVRTENGAKLMCINPSQLLKDHSARPSIDTSPNLDSLSSGFAMSSDELQERAFNVRLH